MAATALSWSDRSFRSGCYTSDEYRRLLTSHGLVGSISKKGCCWDNAVAESFFGNLKQERGHWKSDQTPSEAQQDILNYITMWYNSYRLHSYLDYHSPNDFELINVEFKRLLTRVSEFS
jgi:putative transposase